MLKSIRNGHLLFLFACLAALVCLGDRFPLHLEPKFGIDLQDGFRYTYEGTINRTIEGPFIYRILVPYAVQLVHNIIPVLSPLNITLGIQFVFLTAFQWMFFRFLAFRLTPGIALGGVLAFDTMITFMLSQFHGINMIETIDIVNVFFMVWAMVYVQKGKWWLALAVMAIGMLNRETPLILLPALLFFQWKKESPGYFRIITIIALMGPYLCLRWFIEEGETPAFILRDFSFNIPFLDWQHTPIALKANLFLFLFLLAAPLALFSAIGFRQHPLLWRVLALSCIPLMVVHYTVGTIYESRLWMPLLLFLIPTAFRNVQKRLKIT